MKFMSTLTFFSFPFQYMFVAKGRAPLEPYYGRHIGPFMEFAHKIKVQLENRNYVKMLYTHCRLLLSPTKKNLCEHNNSDINLY